MRGLTKNERLALDPSAIEPDQIYLRPIEWYRTRIALWRHGRLKDPIEVAPTDLGRLALRVCPVEGS